MPKHQKAHRTDSVGIIRYKIIFGEYLRGLKRIMKCKKCKADIPDELHPVYCCYCGEKLQRERKKKDEIKIPTPRKRGQKWYVDLRREGVTVAEDTEAAAKAKAIAIRAGFIASNKSVPKLTLRQAIDKYIEARDNILSPATVRGYRIIQRNAFPSVMNDDISSVSSWQTVINIEARRVKAKTLKNEWGLVRTVLAENGIHADGVMPQVIRNELSWLDFEQIKLFLDAIYGEPCEMGALFALHGLRRSELLAVTPNKINGQTILVEGSAVLNTNNALVRKEENKNTSSRREVPIMIPRLAELIKAYDGDPDKPFLHYPSPNVLYVQINRVCDKAGLPRVGVHGLRRSFASLAYHLGWSEHQTMRIGGWSNTQTVHNVYIKLAQSDSSEDVEKMRQYYDFTTNFTTAPKNH